MEIKRIVIQRAKQTGDTELTSFVERTVEGFRNLKIDSIRGNILLRFSDDCAKTFEAKVTGTESEIRYGNIVTNRNLSAHGDSIHMTFDELIQSHKLAKDVLKAMSDALNHMVLDELIQSHQQAKNVLQAISDVLNP